MTDTVPKLDWSDIRYTSDTVTHSVGPFTVTATVAADEWDNYPWQHDDSTPKPETIRQNYRGTFSKRPSQVIVNSDRWNAEVIDFADLVRRYRKEWGCTGRQAHENALATVKRLRDWYANDWWYVVATVRITFRGAELAESACGGIESDAVDYLASEVLPDLFADAWALAKEEAEAMRDALTTLTMESLTND